MKGWIHDKHQVAGDESFNDPTNLSGTHVFLKKTCQLSSNNISLTILRCRRKAVLSIWSMIFAWTPVQLIIYDH